MVTETYILHIKKQINKKTETCPGGVPRDVSDRPKHIFCSPRDDGMALVSSPAVYDRKYSFYKA